MTKRMKWLYISTAILLFLVFAVWAVIRYVPWNKLVKVPTSSELGFVTQNPGSMKAPNTMQLDFEIDSTQETPSRLYKGIAHSGNYSATVYGKNTFSVSIHKQASEIGLENLDGIGMSAWVYAFPTDNEINGSLVFAVNNSVGVNICWKGITFGGPMIPIEQWTKVSGYFNLSDLRFRPDDQIQLYFWNNSDTKLLVDDFNFVFGAPNDRIGDSTVVDLTGDNKYNPKMNIPPFPVQWLEKMDIGNQNGISLLANDPGGEGEIAPEERISAGHFITKPDAPQSMLVIDSSGHPAMYHFCARRGEFEKLNLRYEPEVSSFLKATAFKVGSFIPDDGKDQLLMAGPNGMALVAFKPQGSICQEDKDAYVLMDLIWHTDQTSLYDVDIRDDKGISAGDLNGDGFTELLLFDQKGSWNLLRFDPAPHTWSILASGEEYKNREWDAGTGTFFNWTGPFHKGYPGDEILTVQQDAHTGALNYTIFRYKPQEKKFVRIFPDRNHSQGLVLGFDTLYPGDHFWPVTWADGSSSILRYDRTWRFDLKDLVFNDTTFQILHKIDFSGFPDDQNPKYYEVLRLVPGNWTDPRITSLLVIARNCADPSYQGGICTDYEDLPALPSTLQLYLFNPVKP